MISPKQLNEALNELAFMNHQCDKDMLRRPTLKLDRQTYRDLDEAMIERNHAPFKWAARPRAFFKYPPQIMGFEVEVVL